MASECEHRERHEALVKVIYLEDIQRFAAELTITCADCGRPFQFLGLPIGLDVTSGAYICPDGVECRIAIAPVGTVPQP